MKHSLRTCIRAFTIVEILVVLGILAILVALLFPVLVKAKQSAKYTNGLTNLKQIGLASELYASDYDDSLAAGYTGYVLTKNPSTAYPSVEGLLRPYHAPKELFRDPQDHCISIFNGCKGTFYDSFGSSYLYFFGELEDPAVLKARPAGCIVFSDMVDFEPDRFGVKAVLKDTSAKYFPWEERTKRLACEAGAF